MYSTNECCYSVPTHNRFMLLDNLTTDINDQSTCNVDSNEQQSFKTRDRSSKISRRRWDESCHTNMSNAPENKLVNIRSTSQVRRNNHQAACQRLENKISSMTFEQLVDYCTSRVLSPVVRRIISKYHPYLLDIYWVHDSSSPGAYLAYLCITDSQQSNVKALEYCLLMKNDTSEVVKIMNKKLSSGWLKDLTRDGDVEPNPGPMYHHHIYMTTYSSMSPIASLSNSVPT